jgi:uncharacterized protein (DUF58 family)
MNLVEVTNESIVIGQPLPFALRDESGILLARKGYVIGSRADLESMRGRGLGFYVDVSESERHQKAFVGKLMELVADDRPLGKIAQALVARMRKLVPRHLPMIVSLQDQVLHDVAHSVPVTIEDVHERVVASRLERDGEATVAKLREGGARVVRGPPSRFASAGVDAYLDVKNRGLL